MCLLVLAVLLTANFRETLIDFLTNEKSTSSSPDSPQVALGFAASLGGAFFSSLSVTTARRLRSIDHTVVMTCSGIVGGLMMLLVSLITKECQLPKNSMEPWTLMLTGLLTFVGLKCFLKAGQFDNANNVSLAGSGSCIFYGSLIRFIFLSKVFDFWSLLGAILLLSSVVLLSYVNYVASLTKDSKIRQVFEFFL